MTSRFNLENEEEADEEKEERLSALAADDGHDFLFLCLIWPMHETFGDVGSFTSKSRSFLFLARASSGIRDMSGPEKPVPTWDLSLRFVLLMSSDEYEDDDDGSLLSRSGLKGGFWPYPTYYLQLFS